MLYLIPILALVLLLFGAPDAAAREDDETVRFTVRVFISGDVPEGEVFRVPFGIKSAPAGGSGPVPLYLCGGAMGVLRGDGPGIPCVGRAEPYEYVIERIPKGETIDFRITRNPGGQPDNGEILARGTMTLERDTTLTVHHEFPGDGDGPLGDQRGMPEELPDTGAGGLAPGTTIPAGDAATELAILIGAGCAVLRRR